MVDAREIPPEAEIEVRIQATTGGLLRIERTPDTETDPPMVRIYVKDGRPTECRVDFDPPTWQVVVRAVNALADPPREVPESEPALVDLTRGRDLQESKLVKP